MRIVFDLDFDGGCWPGPLRGEAAAEREAGSVTRAVAASFDAAIAESIGERGYGG